MVLQEVALDSLVVEIGNGTLDAVHLRSHDRAFSNLHEEGGEDGEAPESKATAQPGADVKLKALETRQSEVQSASMFFRTVGSLLAALTAVGLLTVMTPNAVLATSASLPALTLLATLLLPEVSLHH
jgi:hypothetical protein